MADRSGLQPVNIGPYVELENPFTFWCALSCPRLFAAGGQHRPGLARPRKKGEKRGRGAAAA
jgi:hypothetical protein